VSTLRIAAPGKAPPAALANTSASVPQPSRHTTATAFQPTNGFYNEVLRDVYDSSHLKNVDEGTKTAVADRLLHVSRLQPGLADVDKTKVVADEELMPPLHMTAAAAARKRIQEARNMSLSSSLPGVADAGSADVDQTATSSLSSSSSSSSSTSLDATGNGESALSSLAAVEAAAAPAPMAAASFLAPPPSAHVTSGAASTTATNPERKPAVRRKATGAYARKPKGVDDSVAEAAEYEYDEIFELVPAASKVKTAAKLSSATNLIAISRVKGGALPTIIEVHPFAICHVHTKNYTVFFT
jgi:hypothetical protein